jgi:hypothetical protein
MNAKEKAEYLINKFEEGDLGGSTDYGGCSFIDSKQCALIAVYEVQQVIKDLSSCSSRFIYLIDEINYWQEVKQEIEKL